MASLTVATRTIDTQTDSLPTAPQTQGWLGRHKVTLLRIAACLATGGIGFGVWGIVVLVNNIMAHLKEKKAQAEANKASEKIHKLHQNLPEIKRKINNPIKIDLLTKTGRKILDARGRTHLTATLRKEAVKKEAAAPAAAPKIEAPAASAEKPVGSQPKKGNTWIRRAGQISITASLIAGLVAVTVIR
jgi:hypothetical protein